MGIFDQLLSAIGGGRKPTKIPSIGKQPEEKPAPPQQKRNPYAHVHRINDDETITGADIYVPKCGCCCTPSVPRITLTEAEAAAQGWLFRKKSRGRIKLTRYTGAEEDIIIPAQIGPYTVNELRGGLFFRARIFSVQIPDTVKKVGKALFEQSTVEGITIAAPLREIPESFAFSCQKLSHLSLPTTVRKIGASAFANCKKLTSFTFPRSFWILERHAFQNSGLERFTMDADQPLSADGTAFMDTPLSQNYRMIASSYHDSSSYHNEGYRIMLICPNNQCKMILPEDRFYFGKNAIQSRGINRLTTLDCSRCRQVHFAYDAVEYSFSYAYGTPSRKELHVILPPSHNGSSFFHRCVDAHFEDGTPNKAFITPTENGEPEYRLNLYTLHSYVYQLPDRTVSLLPIYGIDLDFEKNAVCSETLEDITFKNLCGDGNLFHTGCDSLHHVRWENRTEDLEVWLPSRDTIGVWGHKYLLKAFYGRSNIIRKKSTFFDSRPFDRMFRKPDTKPPRWTHEENTHRLNEWKRYRDPDAPRLHQRQKILLAVDVLRSTPSLFPNREMYETYLRNHKRYIMLICDTLPEEYAAFLRTFLSIS